MSNVYVCICKKQGRKTRGTGWRVTINTGPGTRGPGTQGPEDPRTRGPGTRGPGTQRSSSVALSFYDRNATCVNVLSSNVRLYRCWSKSPHILHSANPRIVSFIAYKTTSVTRLVHGSYSHCDPRVKGQNANGLQTLLLCVS